MDFRGKKSHQEKPRFLYFVWANLSRLPPKTSSNKHLIGFDLKFHIWYISISFYVFFLYFIIKWFAGLEAVTSWHICGRLRIFYIFFFIFHRHLICWVTSWHICGRLRICLKENSWTKPFARLHCLMSLILFFSFCHPFPFLKK